MIDEGSLSRRSFLAWSAALALQACAGPLRRGVPAPGDSEPQFYAASPGHYLNFDQDFSGVRYEKVVASPSAAISGTHRTNLTVIGAFSRRLRAVSLPGFAHSVLPGPHGLLVVPTDNRRWLYTLDPISFDIVAHVSVPETGHGFGGHAAEIPGQDAFAVSVNGNEIGKFGRVSIRDRRTLRELASVPSFGFEAHDLRVSADGKHLYVGHYGSFFGSGPYQSFTQLKIDHVRSQRQAYVVEPKGKIYPACISVVELASGKLLDRLSSVNSGPHCHFALDGEGRVYLTYEPSKLENRPDTMTNPAFAEGDRGPETLGEFAQHMKAGFGTAIAFDPREREVLIPERWTEVVNHFPESDPDHFRKQDLRASLPSMNQSHGLAFHPDGKHYVVTGSNYVAYVERGTHRVVPDLSFPAKLFVHAHTSVG
jgi:hypothetical protein